MPALQSRVRTDWIAQKWRDLAERRLLNYTELYRSGRWQRYYTEEAFRLRMRDVVTAVKRWRELAAQTPADDDDLRPAA
jgi:uncharacterized repeat protein (TIGR03809 family)